MTEQNKGHMSWYCLFFAGLMLVVGTASAANPTISGIIPATGINTTSISITNLSGTNFASGANVILTPVDFPPVHKGKIVNGTGGAFLTQPTGVYVSGNYAYVVSYDDNALEIVDISNPSSPVHKGKIVNGTGGALLKNPMSVYVSGSYAYVASTGSNALEIVDISDPARPVHKGSIRDGTGGAKLAWPRSVYVSGNYAYVASEISYALEIVNVTNPASPVHKGSIVNGTGGAVLRQPIDVYVSGNYAYVVSVIGNSLEIVNVANPSSPVHKGKIVNGVNYARLSGPRSVSVSGNYAYVATGPGLEIVDVSDPAWPMNEGQLYNGTGGALLYGSSGVHISGNYAYISSYYSDALEIVDITNPAGPVHKGKIVHGAGGALLDGANDVHVSGDYAYVASSRSDALEIIDIGTVTATDVIAVSPTQITCVFDLTNKIAGRYNVVVTNPDSQIGVLKNGYNVTEPTAIPGKIGVFRPSTHIFYLDYNGNGAWNGVSVDRQYNFGISGDMPLSGDWNNDGKSEIGVFRPSTHLFYLDYNGNGVWNGAVTDKSYNFGISGDIPVTGDWNNDGKSEIGVFRPSMHLFYLDYNSNGAWNGASVDRQYNFGITGDIPISGDWNNDGIYEIGVFRNSTHMFYLDYSGNGAWNGASVDKSYNFGITGDIPISGDWNSDVKTEFGVFRNSTHLFYLDYNGNRVWNGSSVDRQYNFGITGDKPIAGKWG